MKRICLAIFPLLLLMSGLVLAGPAEFLMRYDRPPTNRDRMSFPTLIGPGEASLRRISGNAFEPYHVCLERALVYCATGERVIGTWYALRGQHLFLIDLAAHRAHLRAYARADARQASRVRIVRRRP